MNIYEVTVRLTTPSANVIKFPYLVAETTGRKAEAKVRKIFEPVRKSGGRSAIGKANCIINNR